jgi:hypothetical protein
MAGARNWWRRSLVVALVAGQVGCATRSHVARPLEAALARSGLAGVEAVRVTAGEGHIRVARNRFVGAWADEAGRCTREMAVPVGIQTFGLGLAVLPAVCGAMTAAMPGMTTRFTGGRMRRGVEESVGYRDLHAALRDAIAAAVADTGREPDATLEVTVTELRVRDDGTLSSVAARARLVSAADQTELLARIFTHDVPQREPWAVALDPALAALSAAIVDAMIPPAHPAASAGLRAEDEP